MAYTPLQLSVFNAAFAGAFAGMMSAAAPNDAVANDYATVATAALAYAQQFDTSYGVAGASDVQSLSQVANISAAYLTGRTEVSAAPAEAESRANARGNRSVKPGTLADRTSAQFATSRRAAVHVWPSADVVVATSSAPASVSNDATRVRINRRSRATR